MVIQHATDNEILEVVDEDDCVIGTATRAEIHRKGLLHRSVHLFIFNSSGRIYLQRRSALKDRHPLKLDSSAAGHVDPGESYATTAVRELEEELGISAVIHEVLRVKACPETDNEHVVLFEGVTDAEPTPDKDEIASGRFVTVEELTTMMDENPEDFVPAFVLLWREYMRSAS
ncbi:MAG: NUDIX domain-containing protein [Desulfomonile tiedjei]|nr:NUDIX domain-containing protein [Desulfomonile tiedjei]